MTVTFNKIAQSNDAYIYEVVSDDVNFFFIKDIDAIKLPVLHVSKGLIIKRHYLNPIVNGYEFLLGFIVGRYSDMQFIGIYNEGEKVFTIIKSNTDKFNNGEEVNLSYFGFTE